MRTQVTPVTRRAINVLQHLCLLLACCGLPASIAQAQSISGRITGIVTDPSGAVVQGAGVTVTNEGTGGQRRTTANENGFYIIPELPVGFYALKVENSNFAPATWQHVKVDVG